MAIKTVNDKTLQGMSSSQSNEWVTPKWLFDRYNSIHHFTTDVCTNPDNPMGCPLYFTKDDDGLANFYNWQGNIWCNPPYGRLVDPWVAKCAEYPKTGKKGVVAVLLIAARTDTERFHKYIWDKEKSRWRDDVYGEFLEGRVKFLQPDGIETNNPYFPSMVVTFFPPGTLKHT